MNRILRISYGHQITWGNKKRPHGKTTPPQMKSPQTTTKTTPQIQCPHGTTKITPKKYTVSFC